MNPSKIGLYTAITIFGAIGTYLPVVFGDHDPLSGWSILLGTVGSIVGIWVWYKFLRMYLD